jgi:hypothetical protein
MKFTSKKKGQGIVEYAGALVVAAAIVAAALAAGLDTTIAGVMNDVKNSITGAF